MATTYLMTEVNNYDDHPEFADRLWYTRSIVTLPDRMRKKSKCNCGSEWFDAFRTVGASEIERLRSIIDELQAKVETYETQRKASES